MLIAAITIFCTVVAAGTIFAWMASNLDVKGKSSAINVFGFCEASFSTTIKGPYQGINEFDLGAMRCGETKTVYIKLTNGDERAYDVDICFGDPDVHGTEKGAAKGGTVYYLGSQIEVYHFDENNEPVALGRLVTAGENNSVTMGAISLYSGITVPAKSGSVKGTVTVAVSLEFVHEPDIDQSIYVDFDGKCSRAVLVEYNGV